MFEVRLPQWGMNMVEGTILQWLKAENEYVVVGEPLAEIEIAKATSTLESPVAGLVKQLVAKEGDTVKVNEVIALVDSGGSSDGVA
jgi:pyruvate/2-oxoglutarate dehydrogenase complex dihydrolipoamide acyltransferase (E2) component